MNRKLFSIAALLVLGLFGCASRKEVTAAPQPSPLTTGAAPIQAKYRVKRIADGDTITVVDGRKGMSRSGSRVLTRQKCRILSRIALVTTQQTLTSLGGESGRVIG